MMEIFVGQEACGIIRFPLSSDTISRGKQYCQQKFPSSEQVFLHSWSHWTHRQRRYIGGERDFRIEHLAMR